MVSRFLGQDFTEGLKSPNYVNGRLLSAADLQADQEAMLARLAAVGRAAGYGVLHGLTVTRSENNLVVSAGVGVNKKGQVLHLKTDSVVLPVSIPPEERPVETGAGRFQDCDIPTPEARPVQTGAYLLTVVPTSRLEGTAPVKTVVSRGEDMEVCASRWEVEGLQFRAIQLEGFTFTPSEADDETLRNRLAHWCYGSELLKQLTRRPFSFPEKYGGLEDVADLTDCDLPLAVFYWQAGTLRFVDMWAVRRRIIHPHVPPPAWHAFTSERRAAEGEARFLQFQKQVRDIEAVRNPLRVPATRYFRFLPPVGFLKIVMPRGLLFDKGMEIFAPLMSQVRAQFFGDINNPAPFVQTVQNRLARIFMAGAFEAWPHTAFDINFFFGDHVPDQIKLVDPHTLNVLPDQSWYQEAIDLIPPAPSKGFFPPDIIGWFPDWPDDIFDIAVADNIMMANPIHGIASASASAAETTETADFSEPTEVLRMTHDMASRNMVRRSGHFTIGPGTVEGGGVVNQPPESGTADEPPVSDAEDDVAVEEEEEGPEPLVDIYISRDEFERYQTYLTSAGVAVRNKVAQELSDLDVSGRRPGPRVSVIEGAMRDVIKQEMKTQLDKHRTANVRPLYCVFVRWTESPELIDASWPK